MAPQGGGYLVLYGGYVHDNERECMYMIKINEEINND